jgi:galactose oxidase
VEGCRDVAGTGVAPDEEAATMSRPTPWASRHRHDAARGPAAALTWLALAALLTALLAASVTPAGLAGLGHLTGHPHHATAADDAVVHHSVGGRPLTGGAHPALAVALGTGSADVGRYHAVRNVGSGLCLDVTGTSTAAGGAVAQATCGTTKANQRFWFRQLASSTYQLAAKHSSHCLRIAGGAIAVGALVEQQRCVRSGTGATGTRFTVRQVGTATPARFQLVTDPGGLCLQSPATTSGARVRIDACQSTGAFLWTLEAEAATAPSDTAGRWSPVYPMPSIPVSAAVLPNGKVLTFASTLPYASGNGLEQTHTILLDPAGPTGPVARLVTSTVHDMFCPGTAMLPDGRVMVNGGDNWVTRATSIYDATTDAWTRGPTMTQPRWYNASLTLPTGDVFTLAGNRHMPEFDGNGEIWQRATNTWKALPGARLAPAVTTDPANRSNEHPRLFVAPNGKIFFAGPSRAMQWYDVAGTGSVTSAGTRADDEVSQNAVTVMYDPGKILKAGGNTVYGPNTVDAYVPSNRLAYAIDVTGGGTAVVTTLPPMIYPRTNANGVVLPTGQVLVVGGTDHGRLFTDDGAVLVPELYDPRTNAWTELAPMTTPRGYHSVAVLLPDGRVLAGGGGLCNGLTACPVNHSDIQIYSPPYLFAGTRPTITWAPSATIAAGGGTFAVSVTGTVTGFTLVRMSSVTHAVNTDQRFLRLASTGTGATRTVTAPASRNVAPPGYYMLFAMNGDVPSTARILRIG